MRIVLDLDEVWKIIKDFPNYTVSSCGRIKRISKDNNGKDHTAIVGKILKRSKDSDGYLILTLCKNGDRFTKKVHRLVIEAFKSSCPKGMQVNHKDGNKANPYIENLEYVTSKQNMRHASKMGLLKGPRGELNGQSKLTERKVKKIRKLYKTKKYYQHELADMFGVAQGHISFIVNCKKWKHI